MTYIIETDRLGLRNWKKSDLNAMSRINNDPEVMHYFPAVQDKNTTHAFLQRMQNQIADKGYGYFAAVLKEEQRLIGFIGISAQNYKAPFTPCVDIGWRLDKSYWGKGLANEGGKACLDYAFRQMEIRRLYAIVPGVNRASLSVAKKIGLQYHSSFNHPAIDLNSPLNPCLVYYLDRDHFLSANTSG